MGVVTTRLKSEFFNGAEYVVVIPYAKGSYLLLLSKTIRYLSLKNALKMRGFL